MKEPWWSEEPHWYAIHEVYYDDDDNPKYCTMEPSKIVGVSEKELKWTLDKMLKATEKPVLDFNSFKKEIDET